MICAPKVNWKVVFDRNKLKNYACFIKKNDYLLFLKSIIYLAHKHFFLIKEEAIPKIK